ncbi:MAG: hypothetical protein ACL93V_01685 [Candidatus Electrothrix sp. YB6]
MNGHRKVKTAHEYVRNHLSEWFPELPAYATYIQRLNRLGSVFLQLLPRIRSDSPPLPGPEFIRLIDSTAAARKLPGKSPPKDIIQQRKHIVTA